MLIKTLEQVDLTYILGRVMIFLPVLYAPHLTAIDENSFLVNYSRSLFISIFVLWGFFDYFFSNKNKYSQAELTSFLILNIIVSVSVVGFIFGIDGIYYLLFAISLRLPFMWSSTFGIFPRLSVLFIAANVIFFFIFESLIASSAFMIVILIIFLLFYADISIFRFSLKSFQYFGYLKSSFPVLIQNLISSQFGIMLLSVISIIPSYKDSTSYIYFIYTLMAHLVIFDFIFRFLLKKEYFSFQKSLFLFMLVPICLLPFGLIFHQPLNFLIFKNIYLDMYHFLYLYLFLVIHSFNFVFALYNLKFGYLERRIFISLFSLTCLYSTILVYPNLYFSLILSSLLSVILNVIFWSRNESRRYS